MGAPLKTLLEESSQSCTSQTGTRRTVEFACELFPMRSGKQPDRCWPLIGHKKQTSIRICHGTGSLIVLSPGLARPFLKTFAAFFPDSQRKQAILFFYIAHNVLLTPFPFQFYVSPQCFYSLLHNFYYFPSSMFFIPLLHLHLHLLISIVFSPPPPPPHFYCFPSTTPTSTTTTFWCLWEDTKGG